MGNFQGRGSSIMGRTTDERIRIHPIGLLVGNSVSWLRVSIDIAMSWKKLGQSCEMAFLWASHINFPVPHITLHHPVLLYEDIVPDDSSSPLSICKGGSTTSQGARTCFHDHFSVVGRNLEQRSMSTNDKAITDRTSDALLGCRTRGSGVSKSQQDGGWCMGGVHVVRSKISFSCCLSPIFPLEDTRFLSITALLRLISTGGCMSVALNAL
jgi:hypothetical protein